MYALANESAPILFPGESAPTTKIIILFDIPSRLDHSVRNTCVHFKKRAVDRNHNFIASAPSASPGVDRLIIPGGHAADSLPALIQPPPGDAAFEYDVRIIPIHPGYENSVGTWQEKFSILNPVTNGLPT
jgi:hypothetical protein